MRYPADRRRADRRPGRRSLLPPANSGSWAIPTRRWPGTWTIPMVESETYGRLHLTPEGALGAAVWSIPLEADRAAAKQAAKHAFLRDMGEAGPTYYTTTATTAGLTGRSARREFVSGILGVAPDQQGRGLGRRCWPRSWRRRTRWASPPTWRRSRRRTCPLHAAGLSGGGHFAEVDRRCGVHGYGEGGGRKDLPPGSAVIGEPLSQLIATLRKWPPEWRRRHLLARGGGW